MLITQAASKSHPGTRRHNDDAALTTLDHPLFAVADGMGDEGCGVLAAEIALDSLQELSQSIRLQAERVAAEKSVESRLALASLVDHVFNHAGRQIRAQAIEQGTPELGAALVVCTIAADYGFFAHIGDARAYLFRQGQLIRLTEDHTIGEFKYRHGKISKEEYDHTQERHVLYQTLGTSTEVDVDLAQVNLSDGDIIMLCSDGLTRALSEDEIISNICPADLQRSVDDLITGANERGAPDNVTVLMFSVQSQDAEETVAELTRVMRTNLLFARLSKRECLIIAPYLEEQVFETGDLIVQEGSLSDRFCLVISGKLGRTVGGTLEHFSSGDGFGLSALIHPRPCSYSVQAVEPTRLISLSHERFLEILHQKSGLGARMSLPVLQQLESEVFASGERRKELLALCRAPLLL